MRRRAEARRATAAWALALAGLVVFGAAGTLFYIGRYLYRAEPKVFEGLAPSGDIPPVLMLSTAQQQAQTDFGWPEGFTLLFYSEEDDEGKMAPVRYELWTYYAAGRELAFLDGELVEDRTIEPLEGEVLPCAHHPDQFVAGMALQQVIDSAGLEAILSSPVEEALVPGGELYYAPELIFGTKSGGLAYVQALAAVVED
jgi:hypothetical protein